MFKVLSKMPEKGDQVRCVVFGDDFHRVGEVKWVHQGWIEVDFGFKTERYQAPDLEVRVE